MLDRIGSSAAQLHQKCGRTNIVALLREGVQGDDTLRQPAGQTVRQVTRRAGDDRCRHDRGGAGEQPAPGEDAVTSAEW
jgi:hypothetical protein